MEVRHRACWKPAIARDRSGTGTSAQGWRGDGSQHSDGAAGPSLWEGDIFAEGCAGVHQRALHEEGHLRGTRDGEEGLARSVKGVRAVSLEG